MTTYYDVFTNTSPATQAWTAVTTDPWSAGSNVNIPIRVLWDPNNSLWVVIATDGIWTSANGTTFTKRLSASFSASNLHEPMAIGSSLAVTPADATHVYTSTDSVTWTTSSITGPTNGIAFLDWDAHNSRFVMIEGSTNTVWWSTNGTSWTSGATLPVGPFGEPASGLNAIGSSIFAGVVDHSDHADIYRSTDGGTSFSNVLTGYEPNGFTSDGTTIVAWGGIGIETSTDGGSTWTFRTVPGVSYQAVAYSSSQVLFAGMQNVTMDTSANGTSWTARAFLTFSPATFGLYDMAFSSGLGQWMVVGPITTTGQWTIGRIGFGA